LRRCLAFLPQLLGGIAGESLQTELPAVRLLSELFRFLLIDRYLALEHPELDPSGLNAKRQCFGPDTFIRFHLQ
jgi:hypothetical protein